MRPRRWRPSSSSSRATCCSRSRSRTSTRPRSASCAWASASARACSSTATPSAASRRAWSTCRARTTTPIPAHASRRLLSEALHGESSEFSVQFSDSPLARVLIVVRMRSGAAPVIDVRDLEQRLVRIARRWDDELHDALLEAFGEERGNALHQRYADGFSAGYRDEHAPRLAVRDIELMESLDGVDSLAMSLYVPLEAPPGRLRFKLLRAGQLAPLVAEPADARAHGRRGARGAAVRSAAQRTSASGADERRPMSGSTTSACACQAATRSTSKRLRARFHETVCRTWRGDNENDDFNRLVLLRRARLARRRLLRAYAAHMKQAGFTFSSAYIQQALATHADHHGAAGRAVRMPASIRRSAATARPRRRPSSQRIEAGAGQRLQPRRGPHPAPVPGDDPGDAAHQSLPAHARRLTQAGAVVQVRSVEDSRPARAAADVRDLRRVAARRGRAPARRPCRARRAALVRPQGGLPHRGARAGQGAAGEERGDRAGRIEGRLRAQAACRQQPRPATARR